ncbi:MAG: fused MFS/spermidine synthase [Rhodospirillaceae bacterium]
MQRIAILAISCWSGFLVMGFEMLSGRILAPTFGSSIYVWGAIITVFMLALSVGYLLGGRLSMKHPTMAKLCLIHAAAGAMLLPVLVFEIPVLDGIFGITQDPRLGSLMASVILFFAPAVLSGMVTPYAVRLLVEDAQAAGFYAGLQYFFSTFFSAAGTLLTSFWFVLLFDVDQILLLLFGITEVVALMAFLLSRKRV